MVQVSSSSSSGINMWMISLNIKEPTRKILACALICTWSAIGSKFCSTNDQCQGPLLWNLFVIVLWPCVLDQNDAPEYRSNKKTWYGWWSDQSSVPKLWDLLCIRFSDQSLTNSGSVDPPVYILELAAREKEGTKMRASLQLTRYRSIKKRRRLLIAVHDEFVHESLWIR